MSRNRILPLAIGDRVADLYEEELGRVENIKGRRILVKGRWIDNSQLIYLPAPSELAQAARVTVTGQLALATKELSLD